MRRIICYSFGTLPDHIIRLPVGAEFMNIKEASTVLAYLWYSVPVAELDNRRDVKILVKLDSAAKFEPGEKYLDTVLLNGKYYHVFQVESPFSTTRLFPIPDIQSETYK